MSDEKDREQPGTGEKGRRFRLTRKVKSQAPPGANPGEILTREEREMRELAAMGDDADRGTPEQDAAVRAGCSSMVRVVMLFFVVMIASIVATWCIKQ